LPQPLETAAYLLSETDPSRLPPCAAEAAFIGRSNVGKSSLLNALCRRDVAKVSNQPGRTRAINVFTLGQERWLVDLPGYGFAVGPEAERAGWGPMIEGYLKGRPSLRMIFTLIDAKVGPTKLDVQMVEWLEASGLPWRPVATKADQVKSSRSRARRGEAAHALGVQAEELAWTSAQDDFGVRELRAEVSAALSA
jgi:GTP-binding protein